MLSCSTSERDVAACCKDIKVWPVDRCCYHRKNGRHGTEGGDGGDGRTDRWRCNQVADAIGACGVEERADGVAIRLSGDADLWLPQLEQCAR